MIDTFRRLLLVDVLHLDLARLLVRAGDDANRLLVLMLHEAADDGPRAQEEAPGAVFLVDRGRRLQDLGQELDAGHLDGGHLLGGLDQVGADVAAFAAQLVALDARGRLEQLLAAGEVTVSVQVDHVGRQLGDGPVADELTRLAGDLWSAGSARRQARRPAWGRRA